MPGQPVDRRAAVMGAALALFAERGFHGTRVPDIAARAGVATGTIYRYFATKEALVNAVFQERKRALGEAVAATFPPGPLSREGVVAAWSALVALARSDPVAFRFLEQHDHADYLDEDSRLVSETSQTAHLAVLAAGQAAGLVRADLPAAALASLVWGALIGFVRDRGGCAGAETAAAGDAVWRLLAADQRSDAGEQPVDRPDDVVARGGD